LLDTGTPVATPVTTPAVTIFVVATAVPRCTNILLATPVAIPVGTVVTPEVKSSGAQAVCRTGFCTWVDLTDCINIGECVLACRAIQAWVELDRDEPPI
jgi:hypothetical protein